MDLNEELQNSGLKGLLGSTRLYNKPLAGFALLILSNRDMENIYLGKYLFNKKIQNKNAKKHWKIIDGKRKYYN